MVLVETQERTFDRAEGSRYAKVAGSGGFGAAFLEPRMSERKGLVSPITDGFS